MPEWAAESASDVMTAANVSATPAIGRRAVIAGGALSLPAIAVATTTPAYAGSGGGLTFSRVPADTVTCQPTSSALVVHVDASPNAGKLVQFALPTGWTWANGSGSYVTDSDGNATVPAGDILASSQGGVVTALSAGFTATASLPVALGGPLTDPVRSDRRNSPRTFSDFVRMTQSDESVAAVRSNGDLWAINDWIYGTWALQGSGASTGYSQLAYPQDTGRVLWIKGGQLRLGSDLIADVPASSNSDFVFVTATRALSVAVRSNGDVWRGAVLDPWVRVGTGASSTEADQIAALTGRARSTALWIADGVLYSESGAEPIGNGQNSGFARVYATCGREDKSPNQDGIACAIKANGEVWQWLSTTGWVQVGSGADAGVQQGGVYNIEFSQFNSPGLGSLWISNGTVQKSSDGGTPLAASENVNLQYIVSCTKYVLATRNTGTEFFLYVRHEYGTTIKNLHGYDGEFTKFVHDFGTAPGMLTSVARSTAVVEPKSC